MPILTYLGSFEFIITFCSATFLIKSPSIGLFRKKCIIALTCTAILTKIIKISVNRLRPFIKIKNLNIKKIGVDKYSFPSGHTASAFSLAVMTSLYFPQFTVHSILASISVGVSRMYLGVHYPSDVFIGMLLGTTSSLLVNNFI
jgi:undecaprenyl-diphosphatase